MDISHRHLVALMSVLVLVCVGCTPHAASAPMSTASSALKSGPYAIPLRELVVPSGLIPSIPDNAKAAESAIRIAFGPMLKSVSVRRVKLTGIRDDAGDQESGYRVEYHLTGCSEPAITFTQYLDDTGIIPPITQFSDQPPGIDAMQASRFRKLLGAFGTVSRQPFGALESYRTAIQPSAEELGSYDTTRLFGKTRRVDDLWVVTPGARDIAQFKHLRYDLEDTTGYVFEFPGGGAPVFLGKLGDIGEGADL